MNEPRFVAYERSYGSLIRAVRHERRGTPQGSLFLSFQDGMQSFTDALARETRVVCGEAKRVESWNGKWRVHHAGETIESRDLVLACPAHAAASLLESAAPALASELAGIPYSSAILVTLVYEKGQVAHPLDGFGFLVPQAERHTVAAVTWIGTKFPARIRSDLAAVRAFIVSENAAQLLQETQHRIIELVRSDLERFMGIEAAPRFTLVHAWPASMPQYIVGHAQRLRKITALLEDLPGLHLTGNAYDGVGIPDCVRLAKETAKCIGRQIQI